MNTIKTTANTGLPKVGLKEFPVSSYLTNSYYIMKYFLTTIAIFLLTSTTSKSQTIVSLDSTNFLISKDSSLGRRLFIATKTTANDTVIVKNLAKGKYTISKASNQLTFNIDNKNSLDGDIIWLRSTSQIIDSLVYNTKSSKVLVLERYINGKLSLRKMYKNNFTESILIDSKGFLVSKNKTYLINGIKKSIETTYSNNKKYSTKDEILDIDTFFYENGKVKSVENRRNNFTSNYDNKGYLIEKKFTKNGFIVEDSFMNNLIFKRTETIDGQTIITTYIKGELFQKEIRTRINLQDRTRVEENIIIYNSKGKEIKNFNTVVNLIEVLKN